MPQEPSLAAAPIYPPEIDKANSSDVDSSDDDFQGLGADDDSSEPVLERQPFSTKTEASPTFAYPGFMHTIDQKWTAALLKVMDDINASDYAFGLILLGLGKRCQR